MFTVNILCRDHSHIPHVQAKTHLGCNPHLDGIKPETPQNPKHMLGPHHCALSLSCVLRPRQLKLDPGQSVLDCYETEEWSDAYQLISQEKRCLEWTADIYIEWAI